MYTQDFYITQPVGNNAFSYHDRKNKQLFIPKLKKIQSFDEVKLHPYLSPTLSCEEREQAAKKITFEEFDFDGKMQTCYGLKNLYEYNSLLNPLPFQGKGTTRPKIYLVDNHNHVFYFWYLARKQGIIRDGALLYHIDEHADMRDPCKYLMKPASDDLQKVFEYTNFFLNVGNYIIPAQKEGIIGEIVQIRSENALQEYIKLSPPSILNSFPCEGKDASNVSHLSLQERIERGVGGEKSQNRSIILNLDLDFFQPELDFINYDLKKQVILDIAGKADLITICTSPYFIEQERVLRFLKDIFD